MAATLLLSGDAWDLVLDVNNNIAVAIEPYALAQDAASAIKTFQGECFWDTELGLPYLTQILSKNLPSALLKQMLTDAALTVPNVIAAQVFITSFKSRIVSGQVQVISTNGQQSSPVQFAATNPQGVG